MMSAYFPNLQLRRDVWLNLAFVGALHFNILHASTSLYRLVLEIRHHHIDSQKSAYCKW